MCKNFKQPPMKMSSYLISTLTLPNNYTHAGACVCICSTRLNSDNIYFDRFINLDCKTNQKEPNEGRNYMYQPGAPNVSGMRLDSGFDRKQKLQQ